MSSVRRLVLGLIVSLAVGLLAIGTVNAENRTTIRVLDTVESHGWAMKSLAVEYEKKTGVKVDVELLPYDATYEKEMLMFGAGSSDYDLVAWDCIWGYLYMPSGWILPLEPFMKDPTLPKVDLNGFARGLIEAFDKWDGVLYALPIDYTAQILAYRKDLFKQAGIKEPPKTWEQFLEYAKKLTKDLNNDGKIDQWGWVWHGGTADSMWGDWMVRVQGFKKPPGSVEHILNNDYTRAIFADYDYSAKAIKLIREAMPYAPPGCLGYGYPEATEMFNQGKAAMYITWQVFFFETEDPSKSAVAGKVGYAPPPFSTERNNVMGGWHMGINRNSKNPKEAYKFLAWITSDEGQERMLEAGSPTAYRKKALNDPKWRKKYPVLEAMAQLEGVPLARTPKFVEMQQIIYEQLGLALSGKKSDEAAMKDAQAAINSILKQR